MAIENLTCDFGIRMCWHVLGLKNSGWNCAYCGCQILWLDNSHQKQLTQNMLILIDNKETLITEKQGNTV